MDIDGADDVLTGRVKRITFLPKNFGDERLLSFIKECLEDGTFTIRVTHRDTRSMIWVVSEDGQCHEDLGSEE